MTTTLSLLRQKVSEITGSWKSGTLTTSHVSAPADTSLADNVNNAFLDWYLMITGGSYPATRKLSAFTQSGGVMTPYTNLATAPGLVTYELHRDDPSKITTDLNRAVRELYPSLFVPIIDEFSLITNNILPNSLPADWVSSSAPDKWTVTGLTATQETTAANLRVGTSGLKMVSAGSDQTVMCTNSGNKYLSNLAGRSITLKAWVYASAASKVALRLYDTAQTLSSYHTGDSKWHLLTITETLAQDATNVSLAFGYYVATTTITAYAQQMRITDCSVRKYLLPTSFKDVQQVFMQISGGTDYTADSGLAMCDAVGQVDWQRMYGWYVEDDGTDKWLVFPYDLPSERRLKVKGSKYLTALSSETGTVEADEPVVSMIVAYAAGLRFRQIKATVNSQDYKRYQDLALEHFAIAENLRRKYGMRLPSASLRTPQW